MAEKAGRILRLLGLIVVAAAFAWIALAMRQIEENVETLSSARLAEAEAELDRRKYVPPDVPEPGDRFDAAATWTDAHDAAIYLLTSRSNPRAAFDLLAKNGPMTLTDIAMHYPHGIEVVKAVLQEYLENYSQPLIRHLDPETVALSDFGQEVAAAMREIPVSIENHAWAERWFPDSGRSNDDEPTRTASSQALRSVTAKWSENGSVMSYTLSAFGIFSWSGRSVSPVSSGALS